MSNNNSKNKNDFKIMNFNQNSKIKTATDFLSDSRILKSNLFDRVLFLHKKGLSKIEIIEAMKNAKCEKDAEIIESGLFDNDIFSQKKDSYFLGFLSKAGFALILFGFGTVFSKIISYFNSRIKKQLFQNEEIEHNSQNNCRLSLDSRNSNNGLIETIESLKMQQIKIQESLDRLTDVTNRYILNNPERVFLHKSNNSEKMPWDETENGVKYINETIDKTEIEDRIKSAYYYLQENNSEKDFEQVKTNILFYIKNAISDPKQYSKIQTNTKGMHGFEGRIVQYQGAFEMLESVGFCYSKDENCLRLLTDVIKDENNQETVKLNGFVEKGLLFAIELFSDPIN